VSANKQDAITTMAKLPVIMGLAGSLIGIPLTAGAAPASHAGAAIVRSQPRDCPWDGRYL
jgi:hypothetical protein